MTDARAKNANDRQKEKMDVPFDAIDRLRTIIDNARPGGVVFFGGAGVSTESGIPDFRSPSGLYAAQNATRCEYPPEVMVSRSFFDAHPQQFFEFYFDRMIFQDASPNACHRKLAELEKRGMLRAVITQNIDGLHQAAGCQNVQELHGSVHRNYCTGCRAPFTLEEMLLLHKAASDGVPRCPACDSIVKPDVVLYEEPLDESVLTASVHALARADILVVAGTSLAVYPAAGLVDYFRGDHLVIVNLSPTPLDRQADLCITAPVGDVFDW